MARKTKSGKSSTAIILAVVGVLAFLAISCGLFYATDKSKKDVIDGGEKNKDGVQVVSLIDESIEANRVVDNILLKKDNWQLREKNHGEQLLGVENSKSKVKLNHRDLLVGVPLTTSLSGAGEWLKAKAEASGLTYINGRADKYKSYDAYRVEIGVQAKAGEGTQPFTTDTVWFFHNGNLVKGDKDVTDKPDKSAKEIRKYKGRLAIIIDDCGHDLDALRTLLNTDLPFSYAILPDSEYSSDALEMIKNKRKVAMLHLPMEPLDAKQMGNRKKTVCVDMSVAQKQAVIKKALDSLPGVVGVNNHQGSKATADKATMEIVMKEMKARKLFFVDSRTIGKTAVKAVAKDKGVFTAANDIFLDDSSNVEDIRMQIYKAMELAEQQKDAIAICHARPNTARAWKMYLEEFVDSGINFVPVTELLY